MTVCRQEKIFITHILKNRLIIQKLIYTSGCQFLLMNLKRKFALRLGRLAPKHDKVCFALKPAVFKDICNNKRQFDNLNEDDFILSIEQKGVDIKIGVDIASLAYKKQVDRIVLISGDSDFVPAAKLARREGIDFILDPLFNHIPPDLSEHIDGLRTCDSCYNPAQAIRTNQC